ncbi:DsbA family protein [Succinivibrio dextrinosolvens]|uniref:DsbA family protein n=1 Tax=Succinivibrio dextrinosolvens TaxID=83771 RepID=UPI00192305A3|nr:thioredoxin domain-containing protein [Succinivibrio dextrinosolvens]
MFLKKYRKDHNAETSKPAEESSSIKQADKKKSLNINKLSEVLRQIISNKSSLALCTSYLAVGIATFASVTAVRNSHNNVFLESDENISRTVLSQDENTAASLDTKAIAELEDRITARVIESVSVAAKNSEVSKDTESSISGVKDSEIRFKDKQEFAQAVSEALEDIRNQEVRREVIGKEVKYANAQDTVPNNRHLYGNPQARFLIKEFSDLECPFCKNFFDTPKEVADQSNGQVAVEWVHTPLSFHDPIATNEAIVTECIFQQKGNKAFWVSLQHLFDTTFGNGKGSSALASIPKAFELDEAEYLSCLNSDSTKKIIEDSKKYAAAKGVSGTPGSLIIDTKTGKEQFIGGAQDPYVLMEAIEKLNAEEELAVENKDKSQKS